VQMVKDHYRPRFLKRTHSLKRERANCSPNTELG
jgi:hypothetical protein